MLWLMFVRENFVFCKSMYKKDATSDHPYDRAAYKIRFEHYISCYQLMELVYVPSIFTDLVMILKVAELATGASKF